MSDTQELKELLEKVIQQTKVATEYLQKKIEEKFVMSGAGYRSGARELSMCIIISDKQKLIDALLKQMRKQ